LSHHFLAHFAAVTFDQTIGRRSKASLWDSILTKLAEQGVVDADPNSLEILFNGFQLEEMETLHSLTKLGGFWIAQRVGSG
jgi:hypothetical protein